MNETRAEVDRPRERLHRVGPEALSDAELLALVLRTGTRRHPALAAAADLLREVGGLLGVARSAARELAGQPGVGPAKAASVAAALEIGRRVAARTLREGECVRGPADVHRAYHPRLRDALHERFVVVLLDGRHRVLRDVLVSQGTLTASLVHPREVFRPALREAAAAVILVHNHPSGDPTPSAEDRRVTRRLARAGALLGIEVLDHVVVAERGYVSLREAGAFDADPGAEEGPGGDAGPEAAAEPSVRPAAPAQVRDADGRWTFRRQTGLAARTPRDRDGVMAKAQIETAGAAKAETRGVERRRTARAALVVRVDYSTVDSFFSEFTTDINEGGLFIETDSPAPTGTEVLLKFQLPGADDPVKVQGRVVWTSGDRPSAVPGMGVEFGDLDPVARARINELVRQLRADAALDAGSRSDR